MSEEIKIRSLNAYEQAILIRALNTAIAATTPTSPTDSWEARTMKGMVPQLLWREK
jgi:hypothetical protein